MWAEHPPERPKIDEIREIMLKSISTSRSTNLMDYMFVFFQFKKISIRKREKNV